MYGLLDDEPQANDPRMLALMRMAALRQANPGPNFPMPVTPGTEPRLIPGYGTHTLGSAPMMNNAAPVQMQVGGEWDMDTDPRYLDAIIREHQRIRNNGNPASNEFYGRYNGYEGTEGPTKSRAKRERR